VTNAPTSTLLASGLEFAGLSAQDAALVDAFVGVALGVVAGSPAAMLGKSAMPAAQLANLNKLYWVAMGIGVGGGAAYGLYQSGGTWQGAMQGAMGGAAVAGVAFMTYQVGA
jgi:hypothetical protein